MECLPIKPITHIAGNACRLLWQHFFTVRMTTDAHRGNSECGAAVENYTRERDRDVDKKNQGAIVGLHLSRGGTQTKSNVPHCGHPRHASPLLLWSMRPEAWHTRRLVNSLLLPDGVYSFASPSLLATRGHHPLRRPGLWQIHLVSSSKRYWWQEEEGEKKRRVWFVIAIADGMSPHTATSTAWPYSSWGSNVWRFCCWLAVVVRREQNGAEQADKGRWLVFPLTILY